jgi:uncharacterized membrane protein
MLVLLLGLIVFLGGHSVRIFAPQFRERMVAKHGEGRWKGIVTLVSVVGLILIVWGYGMTRTDPIVVWQPPIWTRHLALVLMIPVFVLIVAAYLPGRIKSTLKHPMLVGVKLWAVAHLLANGTLADILLFGGFLAWAVTDRISLKRREGAPPLTIARTTPLNDALAVIIGLAVYALFVLYLHGVLFGVSPF